MELTRLHKRQCWRAESRPRMAPDKSGQQSRHELIRADLWSGKTVCAVPEPWPGPHRGRLSGHDLLRHGKGQVALNCLSGPQVSCPPLSPGPSQWSPQWSFVVVSVVAGVTTMPWWLGHYSSVREKRNRLQGQPPVSLAGCVFFSLTPTCPGPCVP